VSHFGQLKPRDNRPQVLAGAARLSIERNGIDPKQPTHRSKWPVRKLRLSKDESEHECERRSCCRTDWVKEFVDSLNRSALEQQTLEDAIAIKDPHLPKKIYKYRCDNDYSRKSLHDHCFGGGS
jgi:hypothetical protein